MERKSYMLYLGLGFEFAGLIIAFLYAGRWADHNWDLKGMGVAAGAFLGLAIWIMHLVLVIKANEKNSNEAEGDR